MENQKETSNKEWFYRFIKCVVAAIILWALSWAFVDYLYDNGGDRGTFGDKFGAINALFSGIAAAGMIITLWMQKEELRLQREETEKSINEQKEHKKETERLRKEAEAQKKIMADSLREAGITQLENALFYMLGQYSNIINGISGEKYNGKIANGHDYIHEWADIITHFDKYNYNNDDIKLPMATYVNYLFQIFKYIDNANILDDDILETESLLSR